MSEEFDHIKCDDETRIAIAIADKWEHKARMNKNMMCALAWSFSPWIILAAAFTLGRYL
jgi:hypothetical protein